MKCRRCAKFGRKIETLDKKTNVKARCANFRCDFTILRNVPRKVRKFPARCFLDINPRLRRVTIKRRDFICGERFARETKLHEPTAPFLRDVSHVEMRILAGHSRFACRRVPAQTRGMKKLRLAGYEERKTEGSEVLREIGPVRV